LSLCANRALPELSNKSAIPYDKLAGLSRLGSGSSCRSFYSPWAIWDEQGARAVDLPYQELIHHVVLISEEEKQISSSEAHQRVPTSPLFATRPDRAKQRLKVLLENLHSKNWRTVYELVWQDFHDMHQMFQTANPAFSYINPTSQSVLNYLQDYWEE